MLYGNNRYLFFDYNKYLSIIRGKFKCANASKKGLLLYKTMVNIVENIINNMCL